jgi:flagellar hook-basal body complex protein FliE
MTIDTANPGLRILPADMPEPATAAAKPSGGASFGDSLREAAAGVDNLGMDARYKVSSLVEGNGADVHDAMIAVENVAATNLTNAEAARTATVQAAADMSNVSLMDYLSAASGQ